MNTGFATLPVAPRKMHWRKVDVNWGDQPFTGEPWVMQSWTDVRCWCKQPWTHF